MNKNINHGKTYGYIPYFCNGTINPYKMKTELKTERFDTKIALIEKQIIEKAAYIAGFKSTSSFVISTVLERANAIIEQREKILKSEKDKEIFFTAILNPNTPPPNKKLLEAFEQFKNYKR